MIITTKTITENGYEFAMDKKDSWLYKYSNCQLPDNFTQKMIEHVVEQFEQSSDKRIKFTTAENALKENPDVELITFNSLRNIPLEKHFFIKKHGDMFKFYITMEELLGNHNLESLLPPLILEFDEHAAKFLEEIEKARETGE